MRVEKSRIANCLNKVSSEVQYSPFMSKSNDFSLCFACEMVSTRGERGSGAGGGAYRDHCLKAVINHRVDLGGELKRVITRCRDVKVNS